MSGKRRAGGPTRQLSLQQSSRRPLKKQASEDTSRPQVHGRGFKWDTQSDTSLTVLANSISSSGTNATQERKLPAKPREAQPSIVRPRPVKIAWSERRQLSQDVDNSVGVEVVAQRCKGQPRPVTAKPTRSNLLSVQNDTILYSREQLAERLRVAWRERQETRPNLDIFLAHNSLDHGVNDEDILASSRDCASSVTCSPVPTIVKQNDDKLYTFPSGPPVVQVTLPVTSFARDPKQKQLLDLNKTIATHSMFSNKSSFDNKNVDIFSKTCLLNNNLDEGFSNVFLQKDLNLSEIERQMNFHIEAKAVAVKSVSEITISITPEDNNDDTDDNYCNNDGINSFEDSPSSPTSKKNHLNELELSYSNSDRKSTKEPTPVSSNLDISLQCNKPTIPASVRRVNFKNNSKATIFGSLSVPCTPPATPIPGSAGNKPLSARKPPHPLTRMMSAPANSRSTTKVIPGREKQLDHNSSVSTEPTVEITSDEVDCDPDECLLSRNDRERNIKSAPARRRFKSARRKGIRGRDDNYSTDEEMTCEDKPRNKRGSSRCSSDKSVDIVTMVSLLSPNESDIEDEPCDPVLQLLNDTPRVCEEKEDPPNSTLSKPNPTADAGALKTAGIFCLRKSPKTVCFQQSGNSSLSRSYTASYPSRRSGGSALLVLASEDKCLPSLPVPPALSAPHPLARKKIIKAKSIGPINRDINNEEEAPDLQSVQEKQEISVEIHLPSDSKLPETELTNNNITKDKVEDNATKEEQNENVQTEPDFKSPKEKECWDLYRKMMTKGVSVSYDTVLRGMLTPTEYRLRKTAVFSSC